jgi:hypothetical protein
MTTKETERREEERKKDFIQSKLHWTTTVAAFVHSYHFSFSCLSLKKVEKERVPNTRVCVTD